MLVAFGKPVASDGAGAIKATPASAPPTANSLWLGLRRGPQNIPAANMRQKRKMKKMNKNDDT